ncbi:anti-sigma factor [Nocardia sp. NPDC088792]|uniref:anti-sigma factor n=1 Tax=Nocardia sp. NPDC088792 TaxID=3364332 RepID=UPI0037F13C9A
MTKSTRGRHIESEPASDSTAAPDDHRNVLRLQIPAAAAQLGMLRAITETIMLTADFTLDVVTDMRVALDEVATAMIVAAVPGAVIDCEFRYDAEAITVRVASVGATDNAIDEDSFAWHVLGTLTDSLEITPGTFDDRLGGYPILVQFSRVRSDADDG